MNIIKKISFIFLLIFSISGCKEESIEYPNLPKEGRYFTDHIWVSPEIDLNRDGITSEDLFDEMHQLQTKFDFSLSIKHKEEQGRSMIAFSYPYLYTDENNPNFLNHGASGFLEFFNLRNDVLEIDNPAIISAILLNDSTIKVTSVAEFELIEGKKEVEMKAIYHWNSL